MSIETSYLHYSSAIAGDRSDIERNTGLRWKTLRRIFHAISRKSREKKENGQITRIPDIAEEIIQEAFNFDGQLTRQMINDVTSAYLLHEETWEDFIDVIHKEIPSRCNHDHALKIISSIPNFSIRRRLYNLWNKKVTA